LILISVVANFHLGPWLECRNVRNQY